MSPPARCVVFVRGLTVSAEIGVHGHEHGRSQPLVLDAELTLAPAPEVRTRLADTVDYQQVVTLAREEAAAGHVKLVEAYAERLALRLLALEPVRRVRLRVEKPLALAPDAQAAGVEIEVNR